MKSNSVIFAAGIAVGLFAFWSAGQFSGVQSDSSGDAQKNNEPLYWVAPMDPDYRRDGPGKSPMGMDLVPVYEENSQEDAAGTVRVAPALEHSFGVRTAEVRRGILNPVIRSAGYVEYNDDYVVHIHPRTEGWIEKLHVRSEGDPVEKGAPLYDIYSPTLVNAQEEYLLALRRGNEQLASASRLRLQALQVPEDSIREIEKKRRVSQTLTMRAPQSGVVDQLNVRQGMYVAPGTEVLTLAQASQVWITSDVFTDDLSFIKGGETAEIRSEASPGKSWTGVVDYLYPALNTKTRTAQVRIRLTSPAESLMPGMYTRVVITPEGKEALLIPRDALIRIDNSTRVVLKTGSGKYRSVPVVSGRSDADSVEIYRGLEAGDEVVISAQFMIDSESAKKADLSRFEHDMNMAERDSEAPKAMADGVVNRLDKTARVANISRGPIEKWNRPAATMDFRLSDELDLSDLNEGDRIHFVFKVDQGEFTVISVHPPMTGDMGNATGTNESADMDMSADMSEGHDHD
jgi:Cu(I)/Ag(I) efflux system membrane fusion protein